MKRTFLKFPARPVSYAAPIVSRRMRLGHSRHNRAYRSEGGNAADTEDGEIAAIKAIGEQVENFKTKLGDKADKAQFDSLAATLKELQDGIKTMQADAITDKLNRINSENEKIWKQVIELQEKAMQDKEASTAAKGKKQKFVTTDAVKAFVAETFKDGEKTRNEASIELATNKAAEIFSTATFFEGGDDTISDAFTGRLVLPELIQRKRKTNLILDYFNIQVIGVPKIIYLVKVEDGTDGDDSPGDSGGADWILCGDEKPLRSFRVTTGTAEAKKVAIFGTLEDCLIQDVPSLERWVREDFMDEMREKINDGLLNNNPAVDPNAPLGLKNNASLFEATAGYNNAFTADSTNIIDQLIAVFATMADRKEEAGTAFVSWDNWYKIHHLKGSDGHYLNSGLVYVNSMGQIFIAGVLIVPVDSDDVPSTHVLVIGKDLGFKIYAYGPMVFERGLNEDDFRHDRTSFRGFQRFISFIPEQRENSVLYDTFANIKAGIEA